MSPPKVFISYSHSPDGHREKVIEFAGELAKRNIEVSIDAYIEHEIVDWNKWSENEIRNSDYVIIVCNEYYYNKYESITSKDIGKGVKWEGYVIKNEIYESEGNKKFIPIAFNKVDLDYRPRILSVSNSVVIHDDDEESFKSLCRIIFNKPKYAPPTPPSRDYDPNSDLEPYEYQGFFRKKKGNNVNSEELIYLKTNWQGYEEFLWLKDNSILIKIPEGKFIYGNNIDGKEYRVIKSEQFYIDKYAISNEQFHKFVSETNYKTEAEINGYAFIADINRTWRKTTENNSWVDLYKENTKNHPVVFVTPNDTLAYCDWSSKKLPTSIEWEKAARGSNGQIYPWGNDIRLDFPFANFGLMRKGTLPVDSYQHGASPFGCVNMAGNVWEWCSDSNVSSNLRKLTNKSKFEVQNRLAFVNKGGSWLDEEESLLCYSGDIDDPEPYFHMGFRCVLNI
ncbi:SUMF1/EgtB/PvdO family nonheme iron enzyme [Fulvivirgaceae bacterium BMA10]|uniref:SUMF1/EgtB/PvdO family nonheme iron enzyme n=1 Tax=Splendidivirga corallicola TaxID=3051826 RepID=A0ABT8KKG6_9BACT|nr:SUMF1/EgtB/PvdO family nonheme iron enzyme [Fulvivirgaceae bacterium BMA10]